MKKKSIFKSMFTLALSLALMLSLAVTASAASITIKGNGQEGLGGAERFTAYQIFKGTVGSTSDVNGKELKGVTWGNGVVSTGLVDALKESKRDVTGDPTTTFGSVFSDWMTEYAGSMSEADLVAEFLSDHRTDPVYADEFARIAAKHILGGGTASKKKTEGDGWVIEELEDGYYLVIDNYKSSIDDEPDGAVSSYILQVSGEANVTIKSTIPTVEKKVEGKDGYLTATNKDVTFTLTGTVAENIDEYDTYSYTFTDTLSKGLTIDSGLTDLMVNIVNSGDSTLITKDGNYTATVISGTDDGTHILTVTFTDLKAAVANVGATLNKDSKIVVTYTAQMNDSAVVGDKGNPNDVTLTYSNNPYGEDKGESVPDEVKTYTLGLDIKKQNEDSQSLSGAKFKLKDEHDNYAYLEEVEDGGTITYYVVKEWKTDAGDGTELVTGSDGEFHIHGLAAGTYTLEETQAPDKYEKMKDVTFTITAKADATESTMGEVSLALATDQLDREDVQITTEMSATTGTATLTLTNYKAPILPNTGGIGAKIVYVVSGLAVLAGICVVLAALRKRKDDKA